VGLLIPHISQYFFFYGFPKLFEVFVGGVYCFDDGIGAECVHVDLRNPGCVTWLRDVQME
tara:strand:- start:26932 stop:27111 length:180 start_codon:yes stop_codon:yes gene_type:complete